MFDMINGVHGDTVNKFNHLFVFLRSGKVNERGHCENTYVLGKVTPT
jgi:hypothetical protein